jgi:uncharacterized protein YjiK
MKEVRIRTALVLCGVGWLLSLAATVLPQESSKGSLGKFEVVASAVPEPSGLACDASSGHLFVVGDRGGIAELDASGKSLDAWQVGGNLEDVALLPGGRLLLLDEGAASLILYDPKARREQRRWALDVAGLLGSPGKSDAMGKHGVREGFEGVAVRAGGKDVLVLYLVHQRDPAMVVALGFDPADTGKSLGAGAVRSRWPLAGHKEATAISYSAALDRLLVVADSEDLLLVLRTDGGVEREVGLPGLQQEGVCLDSDGTLWIADDRAGQVLRIPGARAVLQRK